MYAQIEIATVCNFRCFYCAGRDMPQKLMSLELFHDIIAKFGTSAYTVSLQGEGEPTLHPKFWTMVDAVKSAGHLPYTITNASRIDVKRMAQEFDLIGVSIDTLDPVEADRIGRLKLQEVLANFEALVDASSPDRLIVHTVDYGQGIAPLRQYLRSRKVRQHVIQPLQRKGDYAYRYPGRIPAKENTYSYSCRYLNAPLMRYFTIDGVELPCCFIKNLDHYRSADELKESLANRCVPRCCDGCREITRQTTRASI